MKSIFKIFETLTGQPISANGYTAASLPLIKNHKISISPEGYPLFFIKCVEAKATKYLDYNLEFISVQFNRECRLISKQSQPTNGFYTVISLNTESIDLQEYFLDVVYLVVKKLPPLPKLKELRIEVEKLITLFSKFSEPPKKTIQGLWSELLVIEQSKNPNYLIQSWHTAATDKFDFNDGIDKIEVKSTSKSRRVHNFSIEQLNPNKNSTLIVASVFAVTTGMGKSVFDLIKLINQRLKSIDLTSRINEILIETLGKDVEKAPEVFFDYQLAVDSLSFFEGGAIPTITGPIKNEISNIYFDSDLSEVAPIKKIKKQSLLFRSLIK